MTTVTMNKDRESSANYFRTMSARPIYLPLLLGCLLCLYAFCLPAGASEKEEGVKELWGELQLILNEPVVTRTVVENAARLARLEAEDARRAEQGEDVEEDEGAENAAPRPSAADCGLELFTVSSSNPAAPVPKLRWVAQNKLRIDFAPGSSPETEYRLVFKPGTSYLGGAPLKTAAFSFRCTAVGLHASWLEEHAGGAALLTSLPRDTVEAQQLAQRHEGLRVCFRRLRHVPLVGWICTGTVPAHLRPATVADGFGRSELVFDGLMKRMRAEDIREDTPLPQSLVAVPQQPLVPGAYYELGIEAAPGSGFESGNIELYALPKGLEATLERALVQEEGKPCRTRLRLEFSQPVPEEQLRSLLGRLGVSVNGSPAALQEDGSYRAESATLRPGKLIPCRSRIDYWRPGRDHRYHYAPVGCALGVEIDVDAEQALEISLTLPPGVKTRHGLAMAEAQTLSAGISPAAPALTGDGCNLLAWSGKHTMLLPLINVGGVEATAWHWDAASAARLLPLIQHGMRDDTVFCELWQRLAWMRRRAAEGLSTEGRRGDAARTEAGRALRLLQQERQLSDPLRAQALAAATSFAPQELAVNGRANNNGLVAHGWAELKLDALTGGQTRPGLYLISLNYRPRAEVVQALMAYGMSEEEAALPCTVDFLVQVTDMSLNWGRDRLLVNSLTTGRPLEGGQVSLYTLPTDDRYAGAEERLAAARQEAQPTENAPTLSVKQGEAVLPKNAGGSLLLLQRGEDYALFSLWGETVRPLSAAEAPKPRLALFCDRPLYRPGEVAHLRAVLRRPVQGGLVLPRVREARLVIHKPGGEVLETRDLRLDAYGALTADVTLPAGEEDVAGRYRCVLQVEEGGKATTAELELPCEVFRRDAFKATITPVLEPVAPERFSVEVQASDYNGMPLTGGRVALKIDSTVPLMDDLGREAEAWDKQLEQELVLDAQGRATISGRLAAFDKEALFCVSGSVANDREEQLRLEPAQRRLAPADFLIRVEGGERLRLPDARDDTLQNPLPRAQEIELSILVTEEARHELPGGIWYSEEKERELARHRLSVPANCTQGLDLRPFINALSEEHGSDISLKFSGRDARGRLICAEYDHNSHPLREREGTHTLRVEGEQALLETTETFRESGLVHAYISSQGKRRHALVAVEAGAKRVGIPLRAQEYGELTITLVSCERDSRGTCTRWCEREASCERPRPDKELKLEFTLPAGAKPGERVTLQGRVSGADGRPAQAAVTLFAVDAGMMSVAPYTLPRLATDFYRGRAESFSLSGSNAASCEPTLLALPNVWSREGASWYDGQPAARHRSVMPAGINIGCQQRGDIGALFRWGMNEAVRAAEPNFRWSDLLSLGQQMQYEAAPAPAPVTMQKAAGGVKKNRRAARDKEASSALYEEVSEDEEAAAAAEAPAPRLRSNFEPVALWLASLETGADGHFRTECTLPDTLTTYRVFAVALDAGGSCFGQGEGEFLVNQELMLTAGTPFFMSTGDKLQLPLTVSNNRAEAGTWSITLEGAGEPLTHSIRLGAGETGTLHFEVQAGEEGECALRWTARAAEGGADAVEGRFPIRYPAPLLKEAHRLVLAEGGESVSTASLLAPEVAAATRGDIELHYSASPLIHLAGSVDFLLNYPYGCTEQRASALMPWLFYEQLAPFCPQMAMTRPDEAVSTATRAIRQILARQQPDGGLSYWARPEGEPAASSPWASAYAGLVLTIAKEQGFAVPEDALEKLQNYLGRQNWHRSGYRTQYAVARTRGQSGAVNRILVRALRKELKLEEESGRERDTADLEFLAQLRSNPGGRHEALLHWLRHQGKDYRHRTSWNGGWTMIALSEYLRLEPRATGSASVRINGEEKSVEAAPASVRFRVRAGQRLADTAPAVQGGRGSTYVSVKVKARPEQTDYPGVTEKGLQVTRVYEVKDAAGQWRETRVFKVGDVVRVTLTCAKIADELEYFVLEDYLPACMEAINPNVPGQAVGLEDGGRGSWSPWFDHKEYLADRVRGFCTRWAGRDVVNMSYYARVKRAGESVAAPAAAQLMYEPQTYGLSPNERVRSE